MNVDLFFRTIFTLKDLRWIKYIQVDWFSSEIDKCIWRGIVKSVDNYGAIPAISLLGSYLEQDIKNDKLLTDIKERLDFIGTVELKEVDKKVIEDLIVNWSKKEAVKVMLEHSAELYEQGKIEDIWNTIKKTEDSLSIKSIDNLHPILLETEILKRYIAKIDDRDIKIGTMIPSLDRVLGRGLRQGTLSVILGVTSIGKTMFLVYLASAMSIQGYAVLYISLENSKAMIDERFDSLFFNNGSLEKILVRRTLLDNLGCNNLYTMYDGDLTVSSLKNIVNNFGFNIDVIVIDYGDLMRSEHKGNRAEWQELGDIFEELMKWAESSGKIIITASQATKEALQRKILTMKYMGGSFRKAQHAHYVIALAQTQEEYDQDFIRLVLLKSKFGRANITIPCKVIRERQFFREFTGEEFQLFKNFQQEENA